MKMLFTLILLLSFAQSKSQTPNWSWARNAPSGSSGAGEGLGVATDALGNVYICGSYHDSIIFGTSVFPDFNGMFLAKYDSSGNLLWANNIKGAGYGNNVATDNLGNVYFVGWFITPTVIFDFDTLFNAGGIDMFLAKYDSSGNFIWAKRAGGTLPDLGFDVTTDLSGNIYVVGNFRSSSISFDSITLVNADSIDDVFIVKYNALGNILWAKSATGTSLEQGRGVATDSLGNVFITGYFGPPYLSFGIDTLINSGSGDFFIAKYDSGGSFLWAKNGIGNGSDAGVSVATDAFGNIYATGSFSSDTLSFGNNIVTHVTGTGDVFLVKYDSSGNSVWAKSGSTTSISQSYDVATDKLTKVYITGRFTLTSITFGSETIQYPTGALDPMFIVTYNSNGNVLCAQGLVSGGDDQNSVSVSPSGSIYIGGDLAHFGNSPNPIIIGNDSLLLIGQENVFVAKELGNQCPDTVTSATEIKNFNNFILLPNPFNVNLTVKAESNQQIEITLYDILSRKLLQRNFTNTTTINTEQLSSGLYIYEVRNKNGILANGKVIKQ